MLLVYLIIIDDTIEAMISKYCTIDKNENEDNENVEGINWSRVTGTSQKIDILVYSVDPTKEISVAY